MLCRNRGKFCFIKSKFSLLKILQWKVWTSPNMACLPTKYVEWYILFSQNTTIPTPHLSIPESASWSLMWRVGYIFSAVCGLVGWVFVRLFVGGLVGLFCWPPWHLHICTVGCEILGLLHLGSEHKWYFPETDSSIAVDAARNVQPQVPWLENQQNRWVGASCSRYLNRKNCLNLSHVYALHRCILDGIIRCS